MCLNLPHQFAKRACVQAATLVIFDTPGLKRPHFLSRISMTRHAIPKASFLCILCLCRLGMESPELDIHPFCCIFRQEIVLAEVWIQSMVKNHSPAGHLVPARCPCKRWMSSRI